MFGRIEWELGADDQVDPIEVKDRDGHMLICWRSGQPPTQGMIELLNKLTDFVAAREEPPDSS